METIETLHKEIGEIKGNVEKILFILENEGEVKEEVLEELEKARNEPKDEYLSHEDVKKMMQ